MTKLTDIQTILLSSAAQRSDASLLPPPKTISGYADRISKAIAALLKRGLAAEAIDSCPDSTWRIDGDLQFGVAITDAGRVAIGIEPDGVEPALDASVRPDVPSSAPAARPTKAALVLSLLKRDQGATLAELVEATGWLPHTTRAALTGLRKKGHPVAKGKRDDVTCYTVAARA